MSWCLWYRGVVCHVLTFPDCSTNRLEQTGFCNILMISFVLTTDPAEAAAGWVSCPGTGSLLYLSWLKIATRYR